MRHFIIFYTFLFCSVSLYAQRSIQIHKVSSPITIDGIADETDWKQYAEIGNFTQTRPDNGKPSARKTEIAVLYDESYLYVLGIMHVESKDEISSQLSARDNTGNADIFALQIDPFGETREGYDFTITAANVQTDIKLSQNDSYGNFNVVWNSAVKLYDDKWIAEFKIPFNSIRFPKEAMDNFKINFQRVSTKLNEESYWSPIKPEVDGYLNQFGTLEGLPKITPPLNLSLLPFVSVVNEKSPDGTSKTNFNGGLDVKYVHDNSYTLDVSLIPDFSQALSDNQIFNLSPFEVRFNENRQFFIEGTEIFDKGGYLYTRRIGGVPININNISLGENEEIINNPIASNILNLVKVTGKSSKGFSIGVLNGITNKSEATIRNTETNEFRNVQTNPFTNYNALVLDQTLKNNSSITFLNNSVWRSGKDYDSNFSALLFRGYTKNRTYSLYVKKAVSQKYFSDQKNEFGHQYFAYLSKVSGNWTGGISANLYDEKFDNNDFGFLPRNNQFSVRANINYQNNNPKKWFNQYSVGIDHSQRYYYSLFEKEFAYFKLQGDATLKNNSVVFGSFAYIEPRKDFFEPRTKDRHFNKPAQLEYFAEYQTNSNKNFSFAGYAVYVKTLDSDIFSNEFIAGYGLRAQLGQHVSLNFRQDLTNIPSNAGFVGRADDDLIFGKRSVQELTNTFEASYAIYSKLSMNIRVRHYWIQVDYDDQFSLNTQGDLVRNNFTIDPNDFDDNFNSFTIDYIARWQFAPASELSFNYKLGANLFNNQINSSYGTNLKNTLQQDNSNTISLKMTYFLDFNQLRKL
ncbi:DUF5916 domain-containing protein [uncultured Kordia sp.]|uniref:DUF5916 domain-containing protein n=1 Tax=uncultured Kordia sp. TaxID=507699 RepID=UPI002626E508|nr:DUF5916 domain-containing protein [uncultured Kordia sp.]